MKGKEEDEERNENICPRRTDRQSNKQRTVQKLRPPYPLWIVGERGPIITD